MRIHYKIIFQIVIAAILVLQVRAQVCSLKRSEAENDYRIILRENPNRPMELLRSPHINVGESMRLVYENDSLTQVVSCLSTGSFNQQLTNNRNYRKKALVSKHTLSSDLAVYSVGYQYNNAYFLLYNSTFSKSKKRANRTQHYYVPYDIVTSSPNNLFTQDRVVTPKVVAAYNHANVYASFQRLLGDTQSYIPRRLNQQNDAASTGIDRGHLVPAGDFFFGNHIRATYKFLNIIPQFSSINRGNWKQIETWLRNQNRTLLITTGTLDEVLRLQAKNGDLVDMYLDEQIPIPRWMYKIADDGVKKIVFLILNNAFVRRKPTAPKSCTVIDCPLDLNLNSALRNGATFCCEAQQFLNSL